MRQSQYSHWSYSYSPLLSPASFHEPEHCQQSMNVFVATNKPSKTY